MEALNDATSVQMVWLKKLISTAGKIDPEALFVDDIRSVVFVLERRHHPSPHPIL